MKNLSHLFVIDPLKDLNLTLDSSLRMAKSLHAIGHEIHVTTIEDLSMTSEIGAFCQATQLKFLDTNTLEFSQSSPSRTPLASFSAIHMRKDPPTDQRYWSATWILSSVPAKVKQYNCPKSLRNINEKMSILDFPDFSAPALVSQSTSEITEFGHKFGNNDIIVKPLDLFAGKGVERVQFEKFDAKGLKEKIDSLTNHQKSIRIVQPFNHSIFDGEVRSFFAGGQPISWCLKKPKQGEFLANTSSGATLESYEPNRHMLESTSEIAKSLLAKGVFFIGFDIIGDKISEINITSPRLLSKNIEQTQFDKIAQLVELDLLKE